MTNQPERTRSLRHVRKRRAGICPADHDRNNRDAAEIILADRARYERECIFMIRWAEAVLARLNSEQ